MTAPLKGCENVFIPKVKEGAPCGSNAECISDNCNYGDFDPCFGRCAAPLKSAQENEACGLTSIDNCAPGLFCVPKLDGDGSNHICAKAGTRQKNEACNGLQRVCAGNMTCTLNGVCDDRALLAKKGERCDNHNTICIPGLSCIDSKPETGSDFLIGRTCGTPKPAGESCIMDLDCHIDLYCSGNLTNPGQCSTPKTAGASCKESSECKGSLWCKPNADNTANTCVASETTPQTCEFPPE